MSITLEKMKELCRMAGIMCSGNKPEVKKRVKEYLNKYKYSPRYLKDLTREEVFQKKFEIRYYLLLERVKGKKYYSPVKTDKKYENNKKESKYTKKWNSLHENSKSLEKKSKISGVPLDILKKVDQKGKAAWRGGQHRPGATQEQWGIARVNSFLLCGKTFYNPDHLLVKEAIRKSPKAKKYWKDLGCRM